MDLANGPANGPANGGAPAPRPQSGPSANQPASHANPPAAARERVSELLGRLGVLDTIVGQPVPKTRMTGGVVGIEVPREQLVPVVQVLRDALGFNLLSCVTGVDMIDHLESLYHLRNPGEGWLAQLRVKLPLDDPAVDSLVGLYPAANWHERETYDLMGITFRGHPDLRRILLDDEFEGHPLRKSFRPTPMTVHERATTQVDAERAIAGEQQRRQERIAPKHFGQGEQERLHPGKPTFGSAAVFLETGQGLLPSDDQGEDVSEHGDDASGAGPIMKKPQPS